MKRLAKLVSVLAFFAGTAVLHADTPASGGATPPPPPVVSAKASVADLQAAAAKLNAQLGDDARSVVGFRETARKQNDVIKLTCVNDKLVQLQPQQNLADRLNEQLQTALEQNAANRQALYTDLSNAAGSIRRLREEAGACLGEPELYKQESGATFTAPPFVDDPTTNPFPLEIEPPGYCSPFS